MYVGFIICKFVIEINLVLAACDLDMYIWLTIMVVISPQIIYVIRNPKDVIVSMYYYYRMDELMGFYTGTFDDFFDLYLNEHGKFHTVV